jgi:hypothetical protein
VKVAQALVHQVDDRRGPLALAARSIKRAV